MSQYSSRWRSLASLVCLFKLAIALPAAKADISLTHAEVITFRNQVELVQRDDLTRPLRRQDRLGFGDAIQTRQSSQADLLFNDGSQVRLGGQTTFWFIPNSRDLRLTQGTVLLAAAPDSGSSAIATPNAIAITDDAVVAVRHVRLDDAAADATPRLGTDDAFPAATGRTVIMVIAEGDRGAAQVSLRDGRSIRLNVGQMAIINGSDLFIFEFDLALFFETSPLVQGLAIGLATSPDGNAIVDDASPEDSSQSEFDGDFWLDPRFLSPNGDATVDGGWLFPTTSPDATDNAGESDVDTDEDATTAAPEEEAAETNSVDETVAPGATHEGSETLPELTPPANEEVEDALDSQQPNRQDSEQETPPAGVITAPGGSEPATAE
ncbi:MAG: FecR domain-containing protein [Leptolyngbyaceae cyanobacterium]